MNDRYRVDRSLGGGYTVRKTDLSEELASGVVGGAAYVTGSLIGASINGMAALARKNRDRRLEAAVEEMTAAAQAGQHDRLFTLATQFSRRHAQMFYGPAFLGVALTGKGQYDAAIASLIQAEQLGLSPTEAAMIRAGTYEQQGDAAKLIKECGALLRNDETRYNGYMWRARALMQIGDLDQALADVSAAIALAPDEFGYLLRGDIYREKGEPAKAVEDYARADRLYPNWAKLLERRAEALELLGRGDEAQADRAAAQRAKALDEELSEAKALIHRVRASGIRINVSSSGAEIEVRGPKPDRSTIEAMRRLKPQLLQVLARE